MTVLLRASGISKRFGTTLVLDDVSLALEAGRVHALLGANGAGKSTLLNVLGGVLRAEAGSMAIGGQPYAPSSPASARAHGVMIIHQEPAIVSRLSLEANVMLGCERARGGFVRGALHRELAAKALARLGYAALDLSTMGGDLSLPLRHVVALARALVHDARVVVLDEPTGALAPIEAERVLAVVRELALQGVAVLYVTHFLDEVRRATDTWSVLRDGRMVAEGKSAAVGVDELIEHMSGLKLAESLPRVKHALGEVVLSVTNLTGVVAPHGVDMNVRRGEIFGLFGVAGSGRSSLLRGILGSNARTRGSVRMHNGPALRAGAYHGVRAKIALLAEEREVEGLLPDVSVADNVTIGRLRPYARAGILRSDPLRACARGALADVAAAHLDLDRRVDDLSGGMQQRIALARLIHQGPDVFLLDEPARGLDVNAKPEIYRRLVELAAQGRAIVFSSSSVDDLLAVCDTLAVMRQGRMVAVRPVAAWTRADVIACSVTGARAVS